MQTIGYIRTSTDKQDLLSQKHALLEYAQQHQLIIDRFIEIEISSRKSKKERRNITMLMPFGRRQMENKKALQNEQEIEVLFGYREAPPAPEVTPEVTPVVEEATHVESS